MFNLEQSIAEWRQQMLAAGIETPATLEELESHLREGIGEQVQSGINEQIAFEMAVLQMGRAKELKAELAKETGGLNLQGGALTNTNRVLAILWLIFCWQKVADLSLLIPPSNLRDEISDLVYELAIFIYGVGAFGSALLFCGSNAGRNVIRFIAGFGVIAFFMNKAGYSWWPSTWAYLAFNVASLFLLRSPSRQNPHTVTK